MIFMSQVFEAIATEYEIKTTNRKPAETTSAYTSPNRSPSISPSVNRKGQYQLSMMNRRKTVQIKEKHHPVHASDPNIHRSSNIQETRTQLEQNPTIIVENTEPGSSKSCQSCCCQRRKQNRDVRNDSSDLNVDGNIAVNSSSQSLSVQHKLVARLRQASSLADLQNPTPSTSCTLSGSLSNLGDSRYITCQMSC